MSSNVGSLSRLFNPTVPFFPSTFPHHLIAVLSLFPASSRCSHFVHSPFLPSYSPSLPCRSFSLFLASRALFTPSPPLHRRFLTLRPPSSVSRSKFLSSHWVIRSNCSSRLSHYSSSLCVFTMRLRPWYLDSASIAISTLCPAVALSRSVPALYLRSFISLFISLCPRMLPRCLDYPITPNADETTINDSLPSPGDTWRSPGDAKRHHLRPATARRPGRMMAIYSLFVSSERVCLLLVVCVFMLLLMDSYWKT
jgi:hypothetical protein